MEEAIAKGYVDQNDDLAIANLSLKETSDEPGSSIAMKKGSKALKDKINEIVKTLKADGKIDQFVQEANELAQSAEEN